MTVKGSNSLRVGTQGSNSSLPFFHLFWVIPISLAFLLLPAHEAEAKSIRPKKMAECMMRGLFDLRKTHRAGGQDYQITFEKQGLQTNFVLYRQGSVEVLSENNACNISVDQGRTEPQAGNYSSDEFSFYLNDHYYSDYDAGKPNSKRLNSKEKEILKGLSGGDTKGILRKEFCSGKETTLEKWILDPKQSGSQPLDFVKVLVKATELNNGNLFLGIVTAHQLMRNYALADPESKKQAFSKKNLIEGQKAFFARLTQLNGKDDFAHRESWYKSFQHLARRLEYESNIKDNLLTTKGCSRGYFDRFIGDFVKDTIKKFNGSTEDYGQNNVSGTNQNVEFSGAANQLVESLYLPTPEYMDPPCVAGEYIE